MQTRKYPRTMAEAFGPYTSNDLLEMQEQQAKDQFALTIAVAFGLTAIFVLILAVLGFI